VQSRIDLAVIARSLRVGTKARSVRLSRSRRQRRQTSRCPSHERVARHVPTSERYTATRLHGYTAGSDFPSEEISRRRESSIIRSFESNVLASVFPFKDDRARYVRDRIYLARRRSPMIECASIDDWKGYRDSYRAELDATCGQRPAEAARNSRSRDVLSRADEADPPRHACRKKRIDLPRRCCLALTRSNVTFPWYTGTPNSTSELVLDHPLLSSSRSFILRDPWILLRGLSRVSVHVYVCVCVCVHARHRPFELGVRRGWSVTLHISRIWSEYYNLLFMHDTFKRCGNYILGYLPLCGTETF